MCGFFGSYQDSTFIKIKRKSIENLLAHRGPDNTKEISYENEKVNFYTKFFRLSIIDNSKRSDQPYEYKNLILVFNGEIYNYLEIKKYLKTKHNIKFTTTGDTEVLIKFIYYEGFKNISMLEGMWSFVIFNKDTKKTFLCRDRFGEKPIFYNRSKLGLFFSLLKKPIIF